MWWGNCKILVFSNKYKSSLLLIKIYLSINELNASYLSNNLNYSNKGIIIILLTSTSPLFVSLTFGITDKGNKLNPI